MLVAVIAEGVAIALLAVLVLGLLRSHALILKSLHELGAGLELERSAADPGSSGPVHVDLERGVVAAQRATGSAVPDVVGTALDGSTRTVAVRAAGSRTLLAFLTSGCSVCETFWEEFGGPVDVPGRGRLVVVAKGPADESASALQRLAPPGLDVVQSAGAWTDYDIPGSPYFVYVEAGSVTGEGSATTWPQVRDLMAQAVDDAAAARTAAGRRGPGTFPVGAAVADIVDRGPRDDVSRIDSELHQAGLYPGHHSLYEPADEAAPAAGTARTAGDR